MKMLNKQANKQQQKNPLIQRQTFRQKNKKT